jgi:4-diphosphocytidyl-2C-methyl-D-erythritol kinase
VLFIPPDTLPNKTATLFRALDRDGQVDGSAVSTSLARRLPVRVTGADLYNSFERVAFDCFPGLAELWEQIEARTGEAIRLAGAGPTLFWIGPREAVDGVVTAAKGLGCTVIPTATAGSLWRR